MLSFLPLGIGWWLVGAPLACLLFWGILAAVGSRSNRRKQWAPALDAEVKRWSAKSSEQLVAELVEAGAYQVEFEGRQYQVEVQLLENTPEYLHVAVSVDDGSLPASLSPLGRSFLHRN